MNQTTSTSKTYDISSAEFMLKDPLERRINSVLKSSDGWVSWLVNKFRFMVKDIFNDESTEDVRDFANSFKQIDTIYFDMSLWSIDFVYKISVFQKKKSPWDKLVLRIEKSSSLEEQHDFFKWFKF